MAATGNTRERLIETTMTLMWRDGYAGMSVDRICKAAKVNKGSFYHFFPSKEALVLETIDAIWEMAEKGVYSVAFDPVLHPLERLNRYVGMTYAYHREMGKTEWHAEQGCPFGNVGAESGTDDARIRAKVREVYGKEAAYFQRTLEDAVERGAIPPCDTKQAARRAVALLSGLFQHAKVYDNAELLLDFLPALGHMIGAEVTDGQLVVPEPAETG